MNSIFALSPFLILGLGALLFMLAEAFSLSNKGLGIVASVILFATSAFALATSFSGVQLSAVTPWILSDDLSKFFSVLLPFGAALVSLLAGGYLEEHRLNRGEFYTIILFSTFGAMTLAAAGDLLTILLGLETMSLGAYALSAFRRTSQRSVEAGLKYFLLGSFAAAIMLFGFAFLYGVTGHTDLAGIKNEIASAGINGRLVFAFVLIFVGIVFKLSVIPFHMWAPDAYEGVPTPASSLMAATVKAGAFAMAARLLVTVFGDAGFASWGTGWPPVLAWISVITMFVGNLIAGRQDSVKRMLAYSSVVHAGYMLIAFVTVSRAGAAEVSGLFFYLATYTVSTIGAFGALILAGSRGKEAVSYEDLSGLGKRHPAAALAFSFFLLSLAGIPPTAGFMGKWYILRSAINGGFTALAVAGFLASVLGAYYYLRVLQYMYTRDPAPGATVAVPMRSPMVYAALILSAVAVLALGFAPEATFRMAEAAAKSL